MPSEEFVLPGFTTHIVDEPMPQGNPPTGNGDTSSGSMFKSTTVKVVLAILAVAVVFVLYMYIQRRPKAPQLPDNDPTTEHEEIVNSLSREELECIAKGAPPTPVPSLPPHKKKNKEAIIKEFVYLGAINGDNIMKLDPAGLNCILKGKDIYEKMVTDAQFFPSQSQLLTLIYTNKLLPAMVPHKEKPVPPKTALPEEKPSPVVEKQVDFNLDNLGNESD